MDEVSPVSLRLGYLSNVDEPDMCIVTDPLRYTFSALREGELALYRGSADGLEPILLFAPVGEFGGRESRKRLEHEYSLRDELDPEWAARPLSLWARDGRMTLILEDPGGEPLDRFCGRSVTSPVE